MRRRIHRSFLARTSPRPRAPGLLEGALLDGLGSLYRVGTALRNFAYARGALRARALPWPTISVGGLVVGGAGKTPVVILLAETVLRMGRRPLILSRGYGAPNPRPGPLLVDGTSAGAWEEAGDEPVLIARACPGAAVIAVADRRRAALSAEGTVPFDTIILDDGFQHRRLRRDLDLLVLDGTDPWGSGRLLPRGDLREPPSAVLRADAICLSRWKGVLPAGLASWDRPLLRSAWTLEGFRPLSGPSGARIDLKGRRLGVVAGIGRPHRFLEDLEAAGCTVGWTLWLPDHEPLAARDLVAMDRAMGDLDLDGFVVTEKDAVRWESALAGTGSVSVAVGSARWACDDDRRAFVRLLEAAQDAARNRGARPAAAGAGARDEA